MTYAADAATNPVDAAFSARGLSHADVAREGDLTLTEVAGATLGDADDATIAKIATVLAAHPEA